MIVQRWRDRRGSYRPAGETIRTNEYDVEPIPDDNTAKAFILRHHYSGAYVAARLRFGLFRRGGLAGVAVFSQPMSGAVLSTVFGSAGRESIDLGRFVLLDEVPANGETWFLARTFEHLRREGIAGVVAFSDPVPRTNVAGDVVFPGHVGTIYAAHNAAYLGRATARTIRLLPDGRALSERAISKIRNAERGWRYAANLLIDAGAEAPGPDPRAWLRAWLPRVTRPLRHNGTHKFAWALEPRLRRRLRSCAPYPKQRDPLVIAA